MVEDAARLLARAAEERSGLQARLAEIRVRHPAAEPRVVADVVCAVLATMRGDLSATETGLLAEVEELGQTIAAAKAEIAALHVDDINASHIPSATDELDAIIAHTATATERILETCETLDHVAEILGREEAASPAAAASAQLQDATTRIYEACSFQDITGQRITKVVATLKTIESKIAHMISTFGHAGSLPVVPVPVPSAAAETNADAALLNGPQLPTLAMDQSDIDKLLASFD
jgi:chemotaxis protein CheZ